MGIKKALTNPFALIVQGFVAGAILYFATMAPAADPMPGSDTAISASDAKNIPA